MREDYSDVIRRRAGKLSDRIEFYCDVSPSIVSEIELGVLFVMAFWSGPAMQSFRQLLDTVARLDSEKQLRIVVVDTDRISELQKEPPFQGKLHGAGETFWVRDGQIVADSGLGLNLDCIKPNTIALLAGKL